MKQMKIVGGYHVMEMDDVVMNAIKERYGSMDDLWEAVRDEDMLTVTVNLEDDVDCEFDMDEIEAMLHGTLYLNE
jgi:hypothetical protein